MDKKSSFNRDFKDAGRRRQRKAPTGRHLLTATVLSVLIGSSIALAPDFASAKRTTDEHEAQRLTGNAGQSADKLISIPLTLPSHSLPGAGNDKQETVLRNPHPVRDYLPTGIWKTATIKNGESLALLFERLDIPSRQLFELLQVDRNIKKTLARVKPGQTIRINITDSGNVEKLIYEQTATRKLYLSRLQGGFKSHTEELKPEIRFAHASGIIEDSLFLAARKAGLSDNLTMELAGIFGWDIDFALDIRSGDRFTLIYEELYLHGEKLRNGNILAAEFVNADKPFRAVRFTDSNNRTDYYSPDGKSMRKAFLRTPVDFSRISSRYNPNRRHPVLNRIRAHKGVDYAASRGTPIRATGDGKIIFKGIKGGYGKTIVIQHGNRYRTLYAHMNNYARGMRNGKRVKQGQIIGFVGSTGLATGPHLHYEFHVHGVHRNPLTVRLPDAAPLRKTHKAEFDRFIQPYMAQLDILNRMALAQNTIQNQAETLTQ